MENPLHNLQREHTQILGVLGALDVYVQRLEGGEDAPRSDLERFVTFLCELADYRHHDKEEAILLPTLARNGFGWDEEPLRTIRRDHDHERDLVATLRDATRQDGAWSPEARRHVAAMARELVAFLRAHIHREETLLHPAVAARLRPEIKEQLVHDFARFDAENKPDARPELERIAQDLATRYHA